MTVLTPPNPDFLFEGAFCNGIYPVDGMWFPCQIEKVLNEGYEKGGDISSDLKPMILKYLVKFKHN